MGASDILPGPRVASAFLDPFSKVSALVLLCSHSRRDGAPLPESPDTIVRAAHQRVRRELVVDGRHMGGRDEAGTLPDPGRWLIAGRVRHGAALMAFGRRAEGSFVRLSRGREAPTSMAWGEFGRHALIRLPIVATAPDRRRVSESTIQFRLPDGSAQRFLLLAGVAQALIAAREAGDPAARLERTAAARVREHPADAPVLPRDARAIAEALVAARPAFEAGGVFPPTMMTMLTTALRDCVPLSPSPAASGTPSRRASRPVAADPSTRGARPRSPRSRDRDTTCGRTGSRTMARAGCCSA